MTERGWRRLTVALGALLVLLLGLTAAIVFLPGSSGKPPATSAAFASPAASPTIPGSGTGSASPLASAKASASARPSPSSSPTPPPAAFTTILFKQIRLDAGIDPVGTARTVTFNSDGPGTVTARVNKSSPLSTTRLCVAVTGRAAICHDGSTGTVFRNASGKKTNWTVTLAGVGISTPTVDLTLTFRAINPSLKLSGFRFDGSSQAGNNGFVARIKARANGNLAINASWGGTPFDYRLVVRNVTNAGSPADRSGTGMGVNAKFPVSAPDSWQLTFANAQDPGLGRMDLSATLSWP